MGNILTEPRLRSTKPLLGARLDADSGIHVTGQRACDDSAMAFALNRLIGHAGDVARGRSASDLEVIFLRCGLGPFMPEPRAKGQRWAKNELVAATLNGALGAAERGNGDVEQGLRAFVCRVAEGLHETQFDSLRESAQAASFDLRAVDGEVRLLPLDEPAAPLGGMVTAIEADFDRLGFDIAKSHYRQAIDSLVEGRQEAANSQLRATFEETVVRLAESTGFVRHAQGAGGRAISHLIDHQYLPVGDGGDYIRGLWKIVQTNGPHPGASPAGEAHFRTQALTAAMRYLINRLATAGED